MGLVNVKCEWTLNDTSFFFFFFSPPWSQRSLSMWYAATWRRHLAGSTWEDDRTGGKEATARQSECVLWTHSRCPGCLRWRKAEKNGPYTPSKTQKKHGYIGETPQEDPIWLCVFVAVFVIVAHSQFFMVADLSVGAVKHSGVFSCDWDSLEEESVRHGAWLCVCWSSSGGLGECGRWRRAQSSLPPQSRPLHLFLSLLSHSFAPLLSPPSSSPFSLPSLNGGSSLVIRWSP